MPRPRKCRKIGFIPDNHIFLPHRDNTQEVILSIEEVEAIRLSDYLSMDQETSAQNMQISRGTFQRIINEARNKIADAIINGKVIRIDRGSLDISEHRGNCHRRCNRLKDY